MAGLTKIALGSQSKVLEDVPFNQKNIKELADPKDDQDAATKAWTLAQVAQGTSGLGVIGNAEDGTYADGLFTDLTPTTAVGVAVDRFNEVLKSLSPQPAPNLSSAAVSTVGVTGKVSFGASNAISGYTNVPSLDVNGVYTAGGNRIGIINASTAINGTLANNVTPGFTNSRPYPNLSFGNGDTGLLHLVVNGAVVKSVDLSTFGAGAAHNAAGSGFSLSAPTQVQFSNGDSFAVFKYRTGTFVVAAADLVLGYNTIQVKHEYATGMFYITQTFDVVVDGSVAGTTFANESLGTLAMTGSKKLSGVEFHTGGTAKYNLDVNNAYHNTHSISATGMGYNGTNVSITKGVIADSPNEVATLSVRNVLATVNATRLLNGSLTVSTMVDRTVQPVVSSTGTSIAGILLDTVADSSSATSITFNGEARRMKPSVSATSTNYGTGAAGQQQSPWDSTQSLVGLDADHNTGLQVYNGSLQYPKLNFSTLAANGPVANANYSAAAGNRTFLAYFYDVAAHSNFKLNVAGSSISFVPVATGPSGNNLTMEILAPNTTKNGAGAVAWKDAAVAHDGVDTDLGCYAGTYGNVIPANWGCSLGAKNTSTSGNVIVVKITASAAWTGSISSVGITWL